MSLVLFPQQNNQIAILSPMNNSSIDDIIKKDLPPNTPYKIVESLNIDNNFFDAYDFDQELGAIINIDKAKEIQKNNWRDARKSILENLDVKIMKADEQGNTALKQQIAAQKQELRDVTNTPLPDDLEGIKNTWPSILNS
jgi:hypothetical protein